MRRCEPIAQNRSSSPIRAARAARGCALASSARRPSATRASEAKNACGGEPISGAAPHAFHYARVRALFGLLLLLKLLDLEALTLELLLLALNLPLLLLGCGLLVLHRTAPDVAGARADPTANSRPGGRMSTSRPDQPPRPPAPPPPPQRP